MKRRILLIFMLVPIVLMAQVPVVPPTKQTSKPQQSTIKPELRNFVAVLNDQCPTDVGSMKVTRYVIDGNNVIIVLSVDEDVISIDDLQADAANQKNILLSAYQNTLELRHFVRLLSDSKAGLVHLYIGKNSRKQFRITLSSNDIAKAAKVRDKDRDPLLLLSMYVESMNEQLPALIGAGVMNTRVVIEDFYVVYEFVCEEDIFSIEQCAETKSGRKSNLIEAIQTIGGQEKIEFMTIALSKRGVAYRYIGETSGEICEICVNAAELRSALNLN